MNETIPDIRTVLVWKEGRPKWVNEDVAQFTRLPAVMCEICGQPATSVVYEQVDTTQPADTVRTYLPGRPHEICADHIPTIPVLPDEPTETELTEFAEACERADAWLKSLRMVAP